MLEALWTVSFQSNVDVIGDGSPAQGSGILIFESERLFGGDTDFFYVGSYKVKDDVLEGKLHVQRYTNNLTSIFGGLDTFVIVFTAQLGGEQMTAHGNLVEKPEYKVQASLTRRSDLP